jgi:hypothetical protein
MLSGAPLVSEVHAPKLLVRTGSFEDGLEFFWDEYPILKR